MVTDSAVVTGDRQISSIVYGYRFPSHPGRMKIGYSTRGLARVAEQSTAFPEKPELVFAIHARDAKALESEFHKALEDRQADVMGTEWFEVDWPEILAVSPHLRRATGAVRRELRVRMVLMALVGIVMAMIHPLVAAGAVGLANGIPFSEIANLADAYIRRWGEMDIPGTYRMARDMFMYAWQGDVSWPPRAAAVVLSLAPLSLPWVGLRRQAR